MLVDRDGGSDGGDGEDVVAGAGSGQDVTTFTFNTWVLCSLLETQARVTRAITIAPPAPLVLLISMNGSGAVGAGECWWMGRGLALTTERVRVMGEEEVQVEMVVQVSSS